MSANSKKISLSLFMSPISSPTDSPMAFRYEARDGRSTILDNRLTHFDNRAAS